MAPTLKLPRLLFVFLFSTSFLLTACPSFSTLQTTRTVPKGEVRFAVGAEALGAAGTGGGGAVPQFEFSARYGIIDDLDIGAKLYLAGLELGAKYQFLRGAFDMAIAPAFSYSFFSGSGTDIDGNETSSTTHFLYIHLPLLMGASLVNDESFGFDVNFGPKFMYIAIFGSGTTEDGISFGGTLDGLLGGLYVNLPIRLGEAFWLAPEVNVYTNLYSPDGVGSFNGILFQAGLGLYFGGAEKRVDGAL